MTRSPKAAEAVAYSLRNPSQVINSVADDFRAARNVNQGKVPFVRTGTWTYSTNTKPVEV